MSKLLQSFDMSTRKPDDSSMSKGDKLHIDQCPMNAMERKDMVKRQYARLVDSLVYTQVYTRPDIDFAISVLSRYQSNPSFKHWVARIFF